MRHSVPPPSPEEPSNDAITERLARRLAELCDSAGWKHDAPQPRSSLRFWPRGERQPPVTARLAIRAEKRDGQTWKLAYLLLGLARGAAPLSMVETRLSDMQKACRRYGVSLQIGTLLPRTAEGVSMVMIDLSLPLLERALSSASLPEAVALLYGARLELTDLCRPASA